PEKNQKKCPISKALMSLNLISTESAFEIMGILVASLGLTFYIESNLHCIACFGSALSPRASTSSFSCNLIGCCVRKKMPKAQKLLVQFSISHLIGRFSIFF
ncbi:MAG: hypothetical protein ACAH17_02220, partial [Candidatus Paceibacterota bacterium]